MKIGLDTIQREFIRLHYPKLGAKFCVEHLGITYHQLRWFCFKNKIYVTTKRRQEATRENISKAQQKYKKNHPARVSASYFKAVNTPEASYILGLLWADGYINPPYSVTIECVSDDVNEFQKIFQASGDWGRYDRTRKNRRPQSMLQTNNLSIVNYLIDHDYSSKNYKSACSIISKIPNNLRRYWFRGLVDGDGCFYISPDKITRQFAIASSYEQDWKYVETLFKQLNIRYSIKKQISVKGHRSSCIRVTSPADIKRFGEWLYETYEIDKIGLRRKYEKWLLISNSSQYSCKSNVKNVNNVRKI